MKLGEISRKHIEGLQQHLLQKLSVGTSDNVITALKVAIHKAKDWDYIEKSPFPRRLSWPRQKKSRVKKPLTLEEVRRFLQYTPEELKPPYSGNCSQGQYRRQGLCSGTIGKGW